jgi:PHD/YefM family antitoxin component YafN of YafNO toxin-antitoxin module
MSDYSVLIEVLMERLEADERMLAVNRHSWPADYVVAVREYIKALRRAVSKLRRGQTSLSESESSTVTAALVWASESLEPRYREALLQADLLGIYTGSIEGD